MKIIETNAIYSAGELRELVGATLFERIKGCALCKDHYLGVHVIRALDSLTELSEENGHEAATVIHDIATPARKGGGKRAKTRTNRISFDQVK